MSLQNINHFSPQEITIIPSEPLSGLSDPRTFKESVYCVDLPIPAFAVYDPRKIRQTEQPVMDLPVPSFAQPMDVDSSDESMDVDDEIMHQSAKQRSNKAAQNRRKKRKENVLTLPDNHPEKLAYFIKRGECWRNKWVKHGLKAEYFLKRSIQEGEMSEGLYFSKYQEFKRKQESAKKSFKYFFRLGRKY